MLASLREKFLDIDPSLCTAGQVEEAKAIVKVRIPTIMREVRWFNGRITHPGKWHGYGTVERVVRKYPLQGLPENLLQFEIFQYWAHDLGRFFQGCNLLAAGNSICVTIDYYNHGKASVRILELLGVMMLFDKQAQNVIRYAISHHHDRFLKPLRINADKDEVVCDFFVRFLRDLDMLGGLLNKSEKWLYDPKKRSAEIRYYGIGDEEGSIYPKSILADFVAWKAINSRQIAATKNHRGASWEAYMLAHLAWIFNISFRETMEILLKSGIIEMYLDYFERRLPKKQFDLIRAAVIRFLKKEGIDHAL